MIINLNLYGTIFTLRFVNYQVFNYYEIDFSISKQINEENLSSFLQLFLIICEFLSCTSSCL